jgi:CHASE2 domain-containing sensor protein
MTDTNLLRLGGVFGLLAVIAIIPAYLVGYPDAASSSAEANTYFDAGLGTFVFSNGVLPILHVFFFILFLAVLYGVLRQVEEGTPRGGVLPAAALAGGIVFIGLSAAGFAAEIVYPATLLRFGSLEPDAQFVLVSLTLSSWLYHFCQVGASVMVFVTSLVALGTGVLPRWLALVGFVVALLTLLHFLLPLVAALAGLAWVTVVSVLMLTGGLRYTGAARTRVVNR